MKILQFHHGIQQAGKSCGGEADHSTVRGILHNKTIAECKSSFNHVK